MANNWTDEQSSAINLQDKNILVSASAGSGKTAVLVERIINKVIKYRIDIDKIMAVTFTNAAASELKERLYNALSEKIDNDNTDKFLKKQLRLVNKATICTMDSFCLNLVKENFHILMIDPQFKICSNQDAEILRTEAINTVLENEYKLEENSKKLYELLEIFSGKEEKLIDCIFNIYSYTQSFPKPLEILKKWIEKYNIDEEDISNIDFIKNILDDVLDDLNVLDSQLTSLYNEVSNYDGFERYLELLDSDMSYIKRCIYNVKNWDSLYELLNFENLKDNLRVKVENQDIKDKIKNFRNEILKKKIDEIKKRIYGNGKKVLEDNKIAYGYLCYLYEIIKNFNELYGKLKSENNVLEFDDVRHLAIDLLYTKDEDGNEIFSDIANRFKEKFSEVYTDEYQDTNYIQEKILEAISNGKNRFMVGDIKQSIYRFIQARPELFNEKYDNYEMYEKTSENDGINKKIILAKNFRSKDSVIKGINYIFEKIMTKKMGDCSYSGVETLKNGATWYKNYENQDYKVDIEIVDINKEQIKEDYEKSNDEALKEILELEKFEKEAIQIAKKINELKNNFKIYNSKEEKFENAKYSDMVILLRSIRKKGNILETIFRRYDIPSFCDASSNLFLSDEIMLVTSFLKILDNPLLDIDMISVMYSILGKFSLEEITKIKVNPNTQNMSMFECMKFYLDTYKKQEENAKLTKKIEKFLNLYEKFKSYISIYSTSEIIKKMYNDTNILVQYMMEKSSNIKISNLNLFLEIAKEFEKNNSNYLLSDFISYIEKIKVSNSSESVARVIGENEDVVRIMTIHKSKGLEFPIVILADTKTKYLEKDLQEQVILNHNLGIGINIVNEDYNISYPSVIKQSIKSLTRKQMHSEELRMLYVALTRAKEKLCIFATIDDFDKFKNKLYIIKNENNVIEPSIIAKNTDYFSSIYMCLKNFDNNAKNLFNINVTKIDGNYLNNIDENISKDSSDTISSKVQKLFESKKELLSNNNEKIEKYEKSIDNNINFKYKYEEDVITKTRVSVSKLKQESILNSNESIDENIEDSLKLPEFLNEEKDVFIPVRKGIVVHYILENLDFKKIKTYDELKENINLMMDMYNLSDEERRYINTKKIYKFLTSDIGVELQNATNIYREKEFVLNDEKFSKSIIQGIIDLYYITDLGKVVLVDFKTDRMKNEIEYIEKYKIQLDIYKEAIEKILNMKVDEVYIYSFELDKKILIK